MKISKKVRSGALAVSFTASFIMIVNLLYKYFEAPIIGISLVAVIICYISLLIIVSD